MQDIFENTKTHQDEQFDAHSVGTVLREIGASLVDVARSEIQLAKVEVKEAGGQFGRKAIQLLSFGALAALGVLPLMASLIIGLGRLLEDNYWLSSLIVSIVFFATGGIFAFRAYKKMTLIDFNLPQTRYTVEQELKTVNRKIHSISESIKPRAA